MRHFITLALPCLFTSLVACSGTEEVKVEAQMNTANNESSTSGFQADGWSPGDSIPSGVPGVADIQILEVHMNGSGPVCGEGRSASLKYVAMLANGSVLDPGRRPFTFNVGRGEAIKGWDVVVAKMRVGDSFTVTIPQDLAYGPSKGDLKFDMELLSVQ